MGVRARVVSCAAAAAVAAALPGAAWGQAPSRCPGEAIQPDRVVTGQFGEELQGAYVLVPFEVPRGTTAVRVKYCYDQPPEPVSQQVRHTLDLGLYEARPTPSTLWGREEFRGWGGSSHPDVTVSPEGFSTEAQYRAAPRGRVPGRTTRGFKPGPVRAGTWAVELGVGSVVSESEGDPDGTVAWRVEISLARDPAFADEPYRPAPYDRRPARRAPGWYAGDFHVHAEHSRFGVATMTEVFDYAFRPLAQGGAGLDFVNLSDYVTDAAWGEIGRHQPRHRDRAILRASEVITYRGHFHNIATGRFVDYRTGPLYEWRADGSLALRRRARPASEVLSEIDRAGGFTQVNHPTIFPSSVFAGLCRGCPWDYTPAQTGYGLVDGIEVATGPAGANSAPGEPGPNPFVPTAIAFWEDVLDAGWHVAAVGASDSQLAGKMENPTQAPVGQPATLVYADELSERGIQRGVEAGHTYVKLFGQRGPDLRFEARVPGAPERPVAIMGDTVDAPAADLTARVLNAGARGPYELQVLRGREVVRRQPVTGPEAVVSLPGAGAGRYRLQLMRGSAIEAVSSPIWVGGPVAPLRVRPILGSHSRVRRGRVLVGCRASGTDVRACTARVVRRGVEIGAGRALVTGGRAMVEARLDARGLRLLRGRRSLTPVTVEVAAVDREGRAVAVTRHTRLRPL